MTDLEIQAFIKQYGTNTWVCRHAVYPNAHLIVPIAVGKSMEEVKQMFMQQTLALLHHAVDPTSLSLYDLATLQDIYHKNYGFAGTVKEQPDVKEMKSSDRALIFAFYTITSRF